jgi:hypothetical protein
MHLHYFTALFSRFPQPAVRFLPAEGNNQGIFL